MLLLTRLPTGPLLIAGSEAMKHRYLTPITTGEQRAAFGLSEPQAGSDVMGMRTKAVHGRRRLGPHRHEVLDVRACARPTGTASSPRPARPTRGPTTASPRSSSSGAGTGVEVGRIDKKMGVKGVDTGELLLDDVRVPAENVVGDIGGFRLCMLGLNAMRPIVAARGIGLAEGALMYAVEYAKQRQAFTKTIADFQGIQWKIAELATEIEAARLLTYRAAWMADRGQFTKEYVPYLSMCKYYATELAVKVEQPRAADARRRRVHAGPPDGALLPRREAADDRRGHEPGAARPHREGRPRPRPLVGLSDGGTLTSPGRTSSRRCRAVTPARRDGSGTKAEKM